MLDRWLLSELHRLVHDVTAALEAFDTQRAGRLLAELHRRPVQLVRPPVAATVLGRRPGRARDPARVPDVLTLLLAPIVPFITERVWQDVVRPVSPAPPDSVHLATWPRVDGAPGRRRPGRRRWPWYVGWSSSAGPPGPSRRSATASRSAGRWSAAPGWAALPDELARRSPTSSTWSASSELAGELVDRSAKGNFRALGKRFGKDTPTVAAAVAAADATALAAALRAEATATVVVDGARRRRDAPRT